MPPRQTPPRGLWGRKGRGHDREKRLLQIVGASSLRAFFGITADQSAAAPPTKPAAAEVAPLLASGYFHMIKCTSTCLQRPVQNENEARDRNVSAPCRDLCCSKMHIL